ncbi:MAG: hypothetical protein ACT4PG_14425 [Panacagrimonas sp.]
MSAYQPKIVELPPQARAEAMDRPYRPSRMPWVIGAVITAILHLIFFSVKWANGPTEAHIQDLMKPDPRKPVVAEPTPVIYQNLRAPIAAHVPRQSATPPDASTPDAAKE